MGHQEKLPHRKTQTPIVAKQISSNYTDISPYKSALTEFAFLPNSSLLILYAEKRYNSPFS